MKLMNMLTYIKGSAKYSLWHHISPCHIITENFRVCRIRVAAAAAASSIARAPSSRKLLAQKGTVS
jgi:hypothetical protein